MKTILNNQIILKDWAGGSNFYYRDAYAANYTDALGDFTIYYDNNYRWILEIWHYQPTYPLAESFMLFHNFSKQLKEIYYQTSSHLSYSKNDIQLIQSLIDSLIIRVNETFIFI